MFVGVLDKPLPYYAFGVNFEQISCKIQSHGFCRIAAMKNFVKFTGKHLWCPRLATFLKKDSIASFTFQMMLSCYHADVHIMDL